MRQLALVLAAAWAVAFAGAAHADPLRYGVADDYPVFHSCGDVWWQSANDIGYHDLRMTVKWDGSNTIPNQAILKAAVDCALLNNIRPILAIYPLQPNAIGSNDAAQQAFAGFVALVGQAFPQVQNFIVGNEPNVNRFWQPQYTGGQDAAGKDYEHTLAYSYDALKVARPDATVWGPAISSRGNDNANATSNASHSPVWFIKDMADAYKASGRTKPIFDEFDLHPYPPIQDTDPFSKPFQWPQGGAANLDRIKQALWDGFNGTAQPIPAEQAGGRVAQSATTSRFGNAGLPIDLDEVGEQTIVLGTPHQGAYTDPPENVTPIDEPTQAQHYTELAEMAACDPDVKALLYFPLIDNTDINQGFQSGQLYADLAQKQSYGAMKQKIAAAQGQCQGGVPGVPQAWIHTTQVLGATALFGPSSDPTAPPINRPGGIGSLQVSVTANEDATFSAILVNAAGATLGAPVTGTLHAYFKPAIKWVGRIPNGTYTIKVTLTAVTNTTRVSVLTSQPFNVGRAPTTGPSGHGGRISGPLSSLFNVQLTTIITALNHTVNGQTVTTYIVRIFAALGHASQNLTGTVDLIPQRVTSAAMPSAGLHAVIAVKKGKTVIPPRFARIPAGTYKLRVVLKPHTGKSVTLTSGAFNVNAQGRFVAKPAAKPKPKKK
jgi:hypothetical protein